ncbi:MAG: DUF3800 domain-containing protein [Deltaproteobacteria bacterium]|nr:DUF3800 domain-containing protein [Deltaproteobacteria bacterium]
MTTASFAIYIDESGDEGFCFGKGSSDWFVLSAAVVRKANEIETVKLVDTVRARLGKEPKKPLHFRDLKHEQRLPFVEEIARRSLRLVSVLVHKPSLKEPEKFQERYRLYFYSVRYLLERVSWLCRDHRPSDDEGDGTAEIIFSNRSGMSYRELKEYLSYLEKRTGPFEITIDWAVIKPKQIEAFSAGQRMGLQIADAVAGSFFYVVQPSQHGFTEDRYARMLKPVVYHHQGQYWGYGIKVWPREVEAMSEKDDAFRSFKDIFK